MANWREVQCRCGRQMWVQPEVRAVQCSTCHTVTQLYSPVNKAHGANHLRNGFQQQMIPQQPSPRQYHEQQQQPQMMPQPPLSPPQMMAQPPPLGQYHEEEEEPQMMMTRPSPKRQYYEQQPQMMTQPPPQHKYIEQKPQMMVQPPPQRQYYEEQQEPEMMTQSPPPRQYHEEQQEPPMMMVQSPPPPQYHEQIQQPQMMAQPPRRRQYQEQPPQLMAQPPRQRKYYEQQQEPQMMAQPPPQHQYPKQQHQQMMAKPSPPPLHNYHEHQQTMAKPQHNYHEQHQQMLAKPSPPPQHNYHGQQQQQMMAKPSPAPPQHNYHEQQQPQMMVQSRPQHQYPKKQMMAKPSPQRLLEPPPSAFGKKRAVLCGVDYRGKSYSLDGCINDAKSMRSLLVQQMGFPIDSILMLTEDEANPQSLPTKKNIRKAMRWLVEGNRAGDSLVFHFSGHGSQQKDYNEDETDGQDEVLCPLDHETEGKIIDDEINRILVRPLVHGAKLHAIIDACNSGTVLDLPFTCRMERNGFYEWENHRSERAYKGTDGGSAFCFSACDDHESSGYTPVFTGKNAGAMTYSFIKAVKTAGPSPTYGHLLNLMCSAVREGQTRLTFDGNTSSDAEPLLTSSEEFDVYTNKFVL